MDKDLARELRAIRKLLETLVRQTSPPDHAEDVRRKLREALEEDQPRPYAGLEVEFRE